MATGNIDNLNFGVILDDKDFTKRIEADNTHDAAQDAARIAESNADILSELRSVIGAPGTSGMVVRTESN